MVSAFAWLKLIKPTPNNMNERPDPFWIGFFYVPRSRDYRKPARLIGWVTRG
jgi:hypothetical protein